MPPSTTRQFNWTGRMELLEDRVVMSADPLGGLLGGAITHHAIADEPPAIEHHLESTPDFWIDQDQQAAFEEQLRQIDRALAEAHSQTGLTNVRANYGFTGIGQTVAVIDSGIAYDHFALGGGFGENYRVVGGWDFTGENDADPYDDGPQGSHGTHVAGIVGGDSGVDQGVAPGVDLVGLRVFDDAGAGYFSWVENALDWIHVNRNSFENPITAVNLSLGVASWNEDTIPSWANLEDEFAQLEADGIFISVSAGNSFASYNEAGLSYPAASSHVVPVMSVDDSGLLSYFSQRHSRAIAAPGRWITSTVPDYAGNNNGIADDYGSMSGTSMAAPYVAGASVIVREAMEFAGYTNITQDAIYDHMIATADSFFDSATSQSYSRLNLEAAIDALMPTDDYGSSLAAAYNLGLVNGPMSMSGAITTLDDVDCFAFTAQNTGTVTFTAANMTHDLEAAWSVTGGSAAWSGASNETLTIDVVAGQDYTVGFSSDSGLGYYDFDITAESSFVFTDWGTVGFNQLSGVSTAGEAWYRVEASSDGYLTVESLFDTDSGQISLELYNSELQQVAAGNAANGASRVDVYASAGDEFYVKVLGTNSDVDFRLTNLVSIDGTAVEVAGTTADDIFTFTAGSTHVVSVNDVSYHFSNLAIDTVNFHGGAGNDTITLTGTAGDETAVLRADNSMLTGTGFAANALGVEEVKIYGNGGSDLATFYDTAGDDRFVASPTFAVLRAQDFSYFHEASGFENVTAFSTQGSDTAFLYDSNGDDYLVASSQFAVLRGANSEYFNQASGFSSVTAVGSTGYDKAVLYDSALEDRFVASPTFAVMRGAGYEYHNYAGGFDNVTAIASIGLDEAFLYDSLQNDRLIATPNFAVLRGEDFSYQNYAGGFDRITSLASSGEDVAFLYGSVNDDRYIASPTFAVLRGELHEYYNYAGGFDRVSAIGNGGHDTAFMYGGNGSDRFVSKDSYSVMRDEGHAYNNYAGDFDRVVGIAGSGGVDSAFLYDSESDDTAIANNSGVYLAGNSERSGSGFTSIELYNNLGGDDTLDVQALDYAFTHFGQWA